jgi:hypothetical protein
MNKAVRLTEGESIVFDYQRALVANTVIEIIRAYGGNKVFAAFFGWSPSRTSNWSAVDHIPLAQAIEVYTDMRKRGCGLPPSVLGIPKALVTK